MVGSIVSARDAYANRATATTSITNSLLRLNLAPSASASTIAQKKRKHQSPYVLAQVKARKAAHVSRQTVLSTERTKAMGHPVRGIPTPFLESFDTAQPLSSESIQADAAANDGSDAITDANTLVAENDEHDFLNHFITGTELEQTLDASSRLSMPRTADPHRQRELEEQHKIDEANAREAIKRIVSVENTSSKDRTRINIQRCIEIFGRHRTDLTLAPKPGKESHASGQIPRAGPDTGSSEVQISILTAKIRTLANFLDSPRGRKDKMNKRNLRLLVHRRQKLLRYMYKKERGGERWQHLIQSLGLTDATWHGEISL